MRFYLRFVAHSVWEIPRLLLQQLLHLRGRAAFVLALWALSPLASIAYAAGNVTGVSTNSTSGYFIAERGPNHRVWKSVVAQTNTAGKVTTRTLSFTEIATGLHVWQNGQFIDASDVIQLAPDGSAAYGTNCQHQVAFSANLNVSGAINLVMPDEATLQSSVLGLRYEDTSSGQNVAIANVQDSIGQILPSLNQVLYTNALVESGSSFYCDILYNHRKNGFEQDVVLREQPPAPEQFGLNSSNTLLEVWTEFFNPPQPVISTNSKTLSLADGTQQTLSDVVLNFGSMRIGHGNAFVNGPATNSSGLTLTPVAKQWVQYQGRTFLVEEVPFNAITAQLSALPPSSSSTNAPSNSGGTQSFFRTLPSRETQARLRKQPMRLAKANLKKPGFLLDYNLINATESNYTFRADSTYYLSGECDFYDTTRVEGGAVLKCGSSTSGNNVWDGDVVWLTGPFRPVILTCTNDNTVGTTLPGSSGIPNLAQTSYLYVPNGGIMHDARFCYAYNGYSAGATDLEITNCQFLKCSHPITANSGTTKVGLHNVLIIMDTNFNYTGNDGDPGPAGLTIYSTALAISGEQVTVDLPAVDLMLFYGGTANTNDCSINFTNSILLTPNLLPQYHGGGPVNVAVGTNLTYYGTSNPGTLFQSVGAGNYYLAANSPYRDYGTSNINSGTLALLAQKTTYPPLVFAQEVLSNNLALFPQAQRDSGSNPDLGYHYDPLDFAFGFVEIGSNVTVTVAPGTAIGCFCTNIGSGAYSLATGPGAQFISQGSPTSLNWVAMFNTVQEQTYTNWFTPSLCLLSPNYINSSSYTMDCRFTAYSIMAQDTYIFQQGTAYSTYPIAQQDCEFHGGLIDIEAGGVFTNCLFERVASTIDAGAGYPVFLRNSLFWNGSFEQDDGESDDLILNNMFYQTQITDIYGGSYTYGYNGYYATSGFLKATNATDKFLTNDPGYETGALGRYYLPTNNITLVNQGNTNASLLGLYQYTTQTNQLKETNSIVDIGYHYVALGTNGLPVDTNGDGIPDYLEDANGNGQVDSGEIAWNVSGDLGLNVIITHPQNNSVLP